LPFGAKREIAMKLASAVALGFALIIGPVVMGPVTYAFADQPGPDWTPLLHRPEKLAEFSLISLFLQALFMRARVAGAFAKIDLEDRSISTVRLIEVGQSQSNDAPFKLKSMLRSFR
jgi:hypothetical protein